MASPNSLLSSSEISPCVSEEEEKLDFAMARGKIQIKRIDNMTSRQVTYSKRRNGLFKKAEELSVLCDAQVSIIIVSSSGRIHEYPRESFPSRTKKLLDMYQKIKKVDLWSSQYERMQEKLRSLKESNRSLHTQIRQRMGQCLDDLSFEELYNLEQEMERAARLLGERKFHKLASTLDTTKKKYTRAKQDNNKLIVEGMIKADPGYGLVDGGQDYDAFVEYSNGIPHILSLGLQLNNPNLNHIKAESLVPSCFNNDWGMPKF